MLVRRLESLERRVSQQQAPDRAVRSNERRFTIADPAGSTQPPVETFGAASHEPKGRHREEPKDICCSAEELLHELKRVYLLPPSLTFKTSEIRNKKSPKTKAARHSSNPELSGKSQFH